MSESLDEDNFVNFHRFSSRPAFFLFRSICRWEYHTCLIFVSFLFVVLLCTYTELSTRTFQERSTEPTMSDDFCWFFFSEIFRWKLFKNVFQFFFLRVPRLVYSKTSWNLLAKLSGKPANNIFPPHAFHSRETNVCLEVCRAFFSL